MSSRKLFNKKSKKVIDFKKYKTLTKEMREEQFSAREMRYHQWVANPTEIKHALKGLILKGELFNDTDELFMNPDTKTVYIRADFMMDDLESWTQNLKGKNKDAFITKRAEIMKNAIELCEDHRHEIGKTIFPLDEAHKMIRDNGKKPKSP